MNEYAQSNPEALEKAKEYLSERQEWLADAVEAVTGNREADPFEVFPAPSAVKDEARDNPALMEGFAPHETILREVAARFGVGPEQDVPGTAKVRILEGGKPWKIEAEVAIAHDVADTIIFAASALRKIGADEKAYLAEKHGFEATEETTEFSVAELLASKLEGFEALAQPEVMPFGYEVAEDNPFVEEATGQLVHVGNVNGKPVMMLKVEREDYVEEGKNKYRYQPDSAALMKFVSQVLSATGDEQSGVGIDTSNTYASRAIDTVRAGYENGRYFDMGLYGRMTLRGLVEGMQVVTDGVVKVPAKTPAHQIPGELHVMAEKLNALRAVLTESQE